MIVDRQQVLDDADRFSVAADRLEHDGDQPAMRDNARMAARRYDSAAMAVHRTDHARASKLWEMAAKEYRRGKSHARAGVCSLHSQWMADCASGKTSIVLAADVSWLVPTPIGSTKGE